MTVPLLSEGNHPHDLWYTGALSRWPREHDCFPLDSPKKKTRQSSYGTIQTCASLARKHPSPWDLTRLNAQTSPNKVTLTHYFHDEKASCVALRMRNKLSCHARWLPALAEVNVKSAYPLFSEVWAGLGGPCLHIHWSACRGTADSLNPGQVKWGINIDFALLPLPPAQVEEESAHWSLQQICY